MIARYREVLREPHVTRMLLTAMVARLPQGMSGLAVLLLLTRQFGYGRAGLAGGICVASTGVSNIVLARAVDRIGARKVLIPSAAGYAAVSVALALLRHHSFGLLVVICVLLGLITPPITSVSRGVWPRLLGEERAQVLYGLEATAQELVFIAGPGIVAVVSGVSGPATAVVVSGALGLVGAVAYATAPPLGLGARAVRAVRQRVLFGTGLIWYVLVGGCLIFAFSMSEIAIVDFVSGRKASATAGVVVAVWSTGSLLGGVRFGAASRPVTDRTLAVAIALAAGGLAVASVAPGRVGLAVILFAGGIAVAPALARLYTRTGSVSPEGASTEAFGWLAVGFLIGSAAGSALGGAAVEAVGARATFVLSACGAGLGLAAVVAGSKRAHLLTADR